MSKKTIVKVRWGGGQQSMVKDHTFALFNFGTLPLETSLVVKFCENILFQLLITITVQICHFGPVKGPVRLEKGQIP